MQADNKNQADIQLSRAPEDPIEAKDLEKTIGFNYRQAIGELVYAYTICRIDIAVPVIILSQFSQQPAKIHYETVKQVFAYLNATRMYGLTYWRPKPREDLPLKPDPLPITFPYPLPNHKRIHNNYEVAVTQHGDPIDLKDDQWEEL